MAIESEPSAAEKVPQRPLHAGDFYLEWLEEDGESRLAVCVKNMPFAWIAGRTQLPDAIERRMLVKRGNWMVAAVHFYLALCEHTQARSGIEMEQKILALLNGVDAPPFNSGEQEAPPVCSVCGEVPVLRAGEVCGLCRTGRW